MHACSSTAFHEHRHFVVTVARRLGRGRFDPEDLAQDVIERWLRIAPCKSSIANPHGWMRVVLQRLVIDRIRRNRTSRVIFTGDIAVAADAPEPAPWWHDLDAGAVEREVASLPPALRETFRMFAFEARSYKEIAAQQGIAVGTVGVRISRVRALLKRRLSERQVRTPGHTATG
jgi:RNA polymerase sigma factor (sigma-70 family)